MERVRAAVLWEKQTSVDVGLLDLTQPKAGEVEVRVHAVGVCHSDLSVLDGTIPAPRPLVLGHEAAGQVTAVGPGVDHLGPGDRVVLSWLSQCGTCFYCTRNQPALCERGTAGTSQSALPDGSCRFSSGGRPVHHMLGLGALAERCVVHAGSVHRIPDDIPFAQAAVIGCAVLTGFGAAVNTAAIETGDTVAVIGCGGVGLNAVQGALVQGAAQVVAIDPSSSRRELARSFGATHAISPGDDPVGAVRRLTDGRGADVAIEAAGREETVKLAVRITRPGGESVLVGGAAPQTRLSVAVYAGLVSIEKRIKGSLYGSSLISRDVARIIDHYRRDEVHLDQLVTESFELDHVADAFAYCADGRGARAVLLM